MKILKGFTLAEVLITLGIIGVVAAMTLPSLITRIRIIQLHSQFNKMYADLNQAARLFYADEDVSVSLYGKTIHTKGERSDDILKRYMTYFKGASQTANNSYGDFDYKHNITQIGLDGKPDADYTCDEALVMLDMSGRLFTMDNSSYRYDYGPKICVDTNGIKPPNRRGYDRFTFIFTEENTVVPYTGTNLEMQGENQTDEEEIKKLCKDRKAYGCAYFALKDKNPTGYGTYWKNFLK